MGVGKKKQKVVGSDKPEFPRPDGLYFIYDQYAESAVDDEPDAYISPISGNIEFVALDDMDKAPVGEVARGTVAGRFDASYIHVDNAIEEGESLFDVMDCASVETEEIYGALYDPATNELREDVNDIFEGIFSFNLLVINRVEILPAYRGMGLGLATMWHLIRRHSAGCGIVAIKAYPLQFASGFLSRRGKSDWEIKMAYDSFRSGKEVAQEKLISRYKELGFEAVGGEGVMVLSTAMKNPIPKEIHRWVPRSVLRKPGKR